jgi:hypothetical protein
MACRTGGRKAASRFLIWLRPATLTVATLRNWEPLWRSELQVGKIMRSSWSEPYLWLHLAGIAAVPLLLEFCLVGLVASHSWLAVGLVAIAGIAPIAWMQWQRPFSIFSLVVVALKPSQMTEMQRRILGQFKLPIGKVVTVITAVLALVLLWKLQQWVPAVTQPIDLPAGPLGGLLLATAAFLLTNLFLQVPASVLPVLLTTDSQLGAPYPVAQIPQDFTLLGFQLKQILPVADAGKTSATEAPPAEAPVEPPAVELPVEPPAVKSPSSPIGQIEEAEIEEAEIVEEMSPVAQAEEAEIVEEIAAPDQEAPDQEVEEIKTEIFEAEILEAVETGQVEANQVEPNQVAANQVEPVSKVSEPIEAPAPQPAIPDLELPDSTPIQQSQLTVSDPSFNSSPDSNPPDSSPNASDTVVTVGLPTEPPLESATSHEADLLADPADPIDLDAQSPHVKHTIVEIKQDDNLDDYH